MGSSPSFLLCHSFISFASSLPLLSFFYFFLPLLSQQRIPQTLSSLLRRWIKRRLAGLFGDGGVRRGMSSAGGGAGFFFWSSLCSLIAALLYPSSSSMQHQTPFRSSPANNNGVLGCELLSLARLGFGKVATRVRYSKAAAVMVNGASNEQGNGSWLCSKGANRPRWGTSIRCWRGSPE